MSAEMMLISTPVMNPAFIGACHQVRGYLPSRATNASSRAMSEAEKLLSCLAAFRDESAPAGLAPNLLPHVSFSVFVVAAKGDMRDILETCSAMPYLLADTTVTKVLAAVVTGTLAQWRDAVAAGSSRKAKSSVRAAFNKLYHLFRNANLNAWSDYRTSKAPDQTLLLEYKPR